MIDLVNWAMSETPQHIARGDELEPPLTCYGKWGGYGEDGRSWDTCYVVYRIARDQLTKMGYDAAAVISTWRERRWLIIDTNSSSPTKTASMPRTRMTARFLALTRTGYDGAHTLHEQDIAREIAEDRKRMEEARDLEERGLWG